jgi:hypothetical protein
MDEWFVAFVMAYGGYSIGRDFASLAIDLYDRFKGKVHE